MIWQGLPDHQLMSDYYDPNSEVVLGFGMAIDEPRVVQDLDAMTKAELLAEAERRGVAVAPGATKAEIQKALG
jgi:hypothetical protein